MDRRVQLTVISWDFHLVNYRVRCWTVNERVCKGSTRINADSKRLRLYHAR